MKTYVYDTTKGDGISGLPHEITDEQAKALGVEELLAAAIKNGSYSEKSSRVESPKSKRAVEDLAKE